MGPEGIHWLLCSATIASTMTYHCSTCDVIKVFIEET